MALKNRKICIFGYNVSDALQGKVVGGAELQMALLAETLAENGYEVLIIDREAKSSFSYKEKIFIRALPDWDKGIRGIRLFTHRIPRLLKCLKEANAEIYYVRGCTYLFLAPLYVARRLKAKFVMALSHDSELWTFRERYRIFYIKNANLWDWVSTILPNELAYAIIPKYSNVLMVQHKDQIQLAQSRGLKSIMFPNIVNSDVYTIEGNKERKNFVVVGAISSRKSLHLLIPVIKKIGDKIFEFVGTPGDLIGEKISEELKSLKNVLMHGRLNRKDTLKKIAGAKALVNTSRMEGFPNAFLEAWALGTPVISLFVDPGDVIKTHNLGYFCNGDVNLLQNILNLNHYDINEENLRSYVRDNHSPSAAIAAFEKILSDDLTS